VNTEDTALRDVVTARAKPIRLIFEKLHT